LIGGGAGEQTIEAVLAARRLQAEAKAQHAATAGNLTVENCFAIPRSCVGGLIAKGGQGIKDLQEEFEGVRIFVEREDFDGKRIVVMSFHQSATSVAAEGGQMKTLEDVERLMERCQQKVEALIEDLLQQQQQQQSSV
jgi:hypothetical protein